MTENDALELAKTIGLLKAFRVVSSQRAYSSNVGKDAEVTESYDNIELRFLAIFLMKQSKHKSNALSKRLKAMVLSQIKGNTMTARHLLPPDHPAPPHCIPAYLEIEDLEARAQEADWTGNHDLADRLRNQADDLKASGDLWSPTF